MQENEKYIILFSTTGAVLAGPGGPSTPGGGASWDLGGGPVCRGAWGGLEFFFAFQLATFPFFYFAGKWCLFMGLKTSVPGRIGSN